MQLCISAENATFSFYQESWTFQFAKATSCDCFEKCYLKSMKLKYTHVVFWKYLQHLKQQQEGLSHLISIIKDDLEDIKLIEHGLNESIPIRGGVFSWRVTRCWARTERIIQVHGSPSKAKTGEVK